MHTVDYPTDEVSTLTASITRGARVAYELENSGDQTFEEWLGDAKNTEHATGRNHIAEQLLFWCERAINSHRQPFSDRSDDDQDAVDDARQAFTAMVGLDVIGSNLRQLRDGETVTFKLVS